MALTRPELTVARRVSRRKTIAAQEPRTLDHRWQFVTWEDVMADAKETHVVNSNIGGVIAMIAGLSSFSVC
jgi:hypothetical protein